MNKNLSITRKKNHNVIINMAGISGAGKTTLAKQLSKEYKLKILSISDYRNRYHNELLAWQKMAEQVSNNTIIDTSGLNKFLSILLSKIKDNYITILLKCTTAEASKRNKGKKEGYFPYNITRKQFNRNAKKAIQKNSYFGAPADIIINTTGKTKTTIYEEAKTKLSGFLSWP